MAIRDWFRRQRNEESQNTASDIRTLQRQVARLENDHKVLKADYEARRRSAMQVK